MLAAVADDPSLGARTLATLAEAHLIGRDPERGRRTVADAEAVLGGGAGAADDSAVARLNMTKGLLQLSDIELADAMASFARASEAADRSGEPLVASAARCRLALAHFAAGDVARASRSLDRPRADNARIAFWRDQQLVSAALASIAALDGRFADCERLAAEAVALHRMQGYAYTPGMAFPVLVGGRAIRGDQAGAIEALDDWADAGGRGTWRYRMLVEAWDGEVEAVRESVASRPWRSPERVELFTLDVPCLHLELAAIIDAPALTEGARELVEEARRRGAVLALGWPFLLSRLLGDADLVLGRWDAAIHWFTVALREATRAGARLELGRAQLGLARAATASGDGGTAAVRAREAAVTLDDVGALAFASAARQLCATVDARADAPRPGLRAIVVTDLARSTELNVRAGDRDYVELLGDHDRIIRARLRLHDGMEFKHTGDGICAWFASAADAVACALGIRDDLDRANACRPELPVVARIGITAGEPVNIGGDLFGLAIVAAHRVCELARGGHVYVAEEITTLTRGKGFVFEPVADVTLKGLPGTTRVFEAIAC